MISLFQSSPRFDKSSKWIVILLVALLAGQIAVMLTFGEKGRTAMKNRVERTAAKIINNEAYKTATEREHRIFRSIKLNEFVSSCSWYSAAFGSIVVSILLLSFRWWGAKISPAAKFFSLPSWRLVLWILGISLIALTMRLPRMDLGLYNDEAFNFTRYIHGQFENDAESGNPKFHKHNWPQTLWGNRAANNGVLFSILARVSHDIWQKSTGAVDGEVGEFALRIPSLLAGAAGISVIGLLAYVCIGARASVIAALLTALHPWHLRYSTEARAYGIVMLLATTILLSLILAIREGRWRWWLLFGGAQALCLWAYIGSVYFLIPTNLIAL
ncbi:MAG: glycosyltransferase family 39 protein, partial [Verrucomicrobia bacterium]|nr:glycosyltransferase family 39 protein [Verrucomicrobiota bacterium]